MFHRTKYQIERGLRRANAELSRPFHQAQEPSSESNKTTSHYPSLPQDSIRLFRIQSADGDTAICRLETYPRRIAPRYDAVSYCWGDDTTPATIQVNEHDLQIRKSLLAFLTASLDRNPPLRPLWIDAICLNQDDDVEKADHIPLMGQIYKNASRTIVWLGEADEDTHRTLVFMKGVISVTREYNMMVGIGKEDGYQPEWEAVRRYMRRAWFGRLWVMQEVLLSENIEILCHAQPINVITWKELLQFEHSLQKYNGYSNLLDDNSEDNDISPDGAPHLIEILRVSHRRSGRLHMWYFNEFHGLKKCTEPVDRVWALLGLLSPKFIAMVNEARIIDYGDAGRRDY